MSLLKRFAARLPERWQSELKRIHFGRQIRKGNFKTSEREYSLLPEMIEPGDWVIDVGANIGHYTKRLSELVGPSGRVIAFEPVPATFALLSANVQMFAHANVTLINAAVSDKTDIAGISIPQFSTGLSNCYEAELSAASGSALNVLTISVDALAIGKRIAFIKIDAEGHEQFVIGGMQRLIAEHKPTLLIETWSEELIAKISGAGYTSERLPNSPNVIFKPKQ